VEALDDAVGLWAPDPGGAVLDVLKLQEEFVRVVVRPPAELATVVTNDKFDPCLLFLEGREHIVIEQLDSRDRQLGGVEPGPGMARVAVDGGLEIDIGELNWQGQFEHQTVCITQLVLPPTTLWPTRYPGRGWHKWEDSGQWCS
jgi:hypothetical protein